VSETAYLQVHHSRCRTVARGRRCRRASARPTRRWSTGCRSWATPTGAPSTTRTAAAARCPPTWPTRRRSSPRRPRRRRRRRSRPRPRPRPAAPRPTACSATCAASSASAPSPVPAPPSTWCSTPDPVRRVKNLKINNFLTKWSISLFFFLNKLQFLLIII